MSSGLTTAVLNSDGTSPDRSDLFMMFVRAGRRKSVFSYSSDAGSWSSLQVFCAVFLRMLCTSFLILVKTEQEVLLYLNLAQQLECEERGCCQDFALFV